MDESTRNTLMSSAKHGGRDDWETPTEFYEELNKLYNFTLDAAASAENHKCAKFFTKADDGLTKSWDGETVFVNPPYSQNSVWLAKSYLEVCTATNPITVVALIPARTDTKYWHEFCMQASNIMLVKGRLTFTIDGSPALDKNGRPMPAPFPSAVVEFTNGIHLLNVRSIDKYGRLLK